jgi:LysR family nod box-dependent transcriptional activator
MRFHEFDLNLLVYLDSLLAEGSVSKAAERVGITQPAMSEALARLREYFKDELLVQVAGRSMVLTPLAHSLVGPVREILLRAHSVAAATPAFDPAKSDRKFIVMASDYAFDVLVRRVLIQLRNDAPGIRLEVRRLPVDPREHIQRAEVDLVVSPVSRLSEEHPSERLFEDPITCVVWSRNQLVGESVSLERYLEMGHVCARWDRHMPEHERWFLNRFGGSLRVEVVVPDFGAAVRAIEGTDRIAAVHERHARMYAKQFSLRLVKPPVDFPPLTEYLQWHRHQDQDPGLLWLRSLIASVAARI